MRRVCNTQSCRGVDDFKWLRDRLIIIKKVSYSSYYGKRLLGGHPNLF